MTSGLSTLLDAARPKGGQARSFLTDPILGLLIVCALVVFVSGHMGRRRAKKHGVEGRWLSLAAIGAGCALCRRFWSTSWSWAWSQGWRCCSTRRADREPLLQRLT